MKRKSLLFSILIAVIAFSLNLGNIQALKLNEVLDNPSMLLGDDIVINPVYIEYLKLSDTEKAEFGVAPEPYLFVYTPTETYDTASYPSRYNMRDYSLVTAVKDQGASGLCWSYTMSTVIESSALKQGVSNVVTSPKYFDYITVKPDSYINEAMNPYFNAKIVADDYYLYSLAFTRDVMVDTGGHASYIQHMSAAGYPPAITSVFGNPGPTSTAKISLAQLFNRSNANYSVTEMVRYPTVTNNATEKQEWIDMIKYHIMNYGPLYVSTVAPDSRAGAACWFSSYNMIEYSVSKCGTVGGHGMTIIGWDDNYGPSGQGAWILQNSWGTCSGCQQFPYLSYNSEIADLVGVKKIEAKNWDNSYDFLSMSSYTLVNRINGVNINNVQTLKVQKSRDPEILKYLTFTLNSSTLNQQFDVYISTTGEIDDLTKVGSVNATYNGTYKVPVDNLLLDNDHFLIGIKRTNGTLLSWYTVNAFTTNVLSSTTMTMNTHIENSTHIRDFSSTQQITLADFVSIKNNQTVTQLSYKVYNSKSQDVTSLFTLGQANNDFKNYAINGKSLLRLTFTRKNLPADWYTVRISQNGYTADSMFDITFFAANDPYKKKSGYIYLDIEYPRTSLISGMKTVSGTTAKIYNEANSEITPDIMGTGMAVRLINSSEFINYITVVRGDTVGEGTVTSSSLLLIRRHILGIEELSGAYYIAGDVDDDGMLTSSDLLLIRRYILGMGEL